jgi:hypothetical protein
MSENRIALIFAEYSALRPCALRSRLLVAVYDACDVLAVGQVGHESIVVGDRSTSEIAPQRPFSALPNANGSRHAQ